MKNRSVIVIKELTIKTVEKIKHEFIDKISLDKKVIIKFDLRDNIDLAGVQFLLSVIKYSELQEDRVILELKISRESKALLEKSGFKGIFTKVTNN
jgi:hypothetical protein